MSTARENILARIRAARRPASPEHRVSPGSWPDAGENLRDAFVARARRLSSDVTGPVTIAHVPQEIKKYLDARAQPLRVVCWPSLAGLRWSDAGITADPRAARGDDVTGVTGCFGAIAETGTLMLLSGADTPASVSQLPETHIALLPVSRLVASMEAAWARLRAEHGSLPRAVHFVSGPSRTADIEQTVTLGAHGPARVLIILVSEELP